VFVTVDPRRLGLCVGPAKPAVCKPVGSVGFTATYALQG
jgi:hypothetical protein